MNDPRFKKIEIHSPEELAKTMAEISKKSAVETQKFVDLMRKLSEDEDIPMGALMAYAQGMLGCLYTYSYVEQNADGKAFLDGLARAGVEITDQMVKLSREQNEKG